MGTNMGPRPLHNSAAACYSSAVRVDEVDLLSVKVLRVCYLLHLWLAAQALIPTDKQCVQQCKYA